MARHGANTVRIIGGAWRGRLIRFGKNLPIRPTPDRVRETLFNWLGQDLTGTRCLDLFAGSGALGFEALSRNASHVDFVDQSRAICAQLRSTATTLDAARFEIHCCGAIEFLERHPARIRIEARTVQSGEAEPSDRAGQGHMVRGMGSDTKGDAGKGFDVVFLDPPYGTPLLARVMAGVGALVTARGAVYFESDAAVAMPRGWRIDRQSKAGMVHFGLAVREEP